MDTEQADRVEQLLVELERQDDSESHAPLGTQRLSWLIDLPDEETTRLLDGLYHRVLPNADCVETALSTVLHQLAIRARNRQSTGQGQLAPEAVEFVKSLYGELPNQHHGRAYCLQVLSTAAGSLELRAFAELVAVDPPSSGNDAAIAFGPLFQSMKYDPAPLFPRLLDAIAEPAVAASIIDLANFLKREKRTVEHPAVGRKSQLSTLLGELAQRLGRLEELPEDLDESTEELAERVENSISLAVSLCDALALMRDASVVGKLYQVMELSHRRLRTEAAAALAQLGEQAGKDALLSMAKEPVTRLRVLAYADELQLTDQIDEQYATPAARAEAELALWLAQPTQLGIPPGELELLDERTLFWPGFDLPVECFLFRFTYAFPSGVYENIGIAGPMCHAFGADLADLPPDDIYAAFAGWQAEHEDIYDRSVDELDGHQQVDLARLERKLHDRGYDDVTALSLGFFLGDRYLVARAVHGGVPCVCAVDAEGVWSFRSAGDSRSIGATEVHSIYKGRKLLRSFNP